ncbi:MAG: hypothetical protein IIA87_01975 [Nanoarchaeota archaeon]|nr:hypothetical protein [Nanoarchaeota archaeon]
MERKLKNYLEKNNVKYVLHKHPAVFTVKESKRLKKNIPGLNCKTLFLKDNKRKFYLVGMPADKRLDNKKLRAHLNIRKIRFGTVEELKDKVNLTPGSVSIFGMIYINSYNIKLILDKEVWESDVVGFHPNINTETLEIKHEDLEKFYNSLDCEKEVIEL